LEDRAHAYAELFAATTTLVTLGLALQFVDLAVSTLRTDRVTVPPLFGQVFGALFFGVKVPDQLNDAAELLYRLGGGSRFLAHDPPKICKSLGLRKYIVTFIKELETT